MNYRAACNEVSSGNYYRQKEREIQSLSASGGLKCLWFSDKWFLNSAHITRVSLWTEKLNFALRRITP